jgi:spore maturation protein CgeB
VNEHLFMPREKVYDVAFLCWPTDERREVQKACGEICRKHGWVFFTGTYDWNDYARFLSSSKVVVHMPHVKNARSWRVFDVMASRGALLTMPLPDVSGDGLINGTHYREYINTDTLERELISLLDYGAWKIVGEAGYDHVIKNHTWRTRSAQLRETLREVFKHDESKMALW